MAEKDVESENMEEPPQLSQYEKLLLTFKNNKSKPKETDKEDEPKEGDEDDKDGDKNTNNNTFSSDKDDKGDISDDVIDNNDNDDSDGNEDSDGNDGKDDDNNVSKADDSDDEDITANHSDPFIDHFSHQLDEQEADNLLNKPSWLPQQVENKCMDGMTYYRSSLSKPFHQLSLSNNQAAKSVSNSYKNLATCNKKYLPAEAAATAGPFTPFQEGLFGMLNKYLDVHMCTGGRGVSDDEVKVSYCVHALTHLLKSTKVILKNNEKLKNNSEEEYRDQGLTKGKVLLMVPSRSHAHKVVTIIIALLYSDKLHVSNRERFMQEFACDDISVKKGLKPDDYEATFDGNMDDNFKLGVTVRKRSLKLFSDFYNSDLIIASPLALKHVIKPNNNTTGHWDFLSSVEILIVDGMHVLLMQNWANVMLVLSHLNKRLVKNHGTDLSRVRMACLNGWSSLYRQNILFSAYQTAEFKCLFNKHCNNMQGKMLIQAPILHGSICSVVSTLPQTFRKFEVSKVSEGSNSRFNFFIKNILPDYLSNPSYNILLFIPSYYDFVRIRNHFTKHDLSFASISDYTEEKDVQKSRQQFFLSNVKFLLFTERFHFYHRYQIKGINHLIFYDLPHNGHFYSEFCNMMSMLASKQSSHHSCLALYCKYDLHKLTTIFGTSRAQRLAVSDKPTHLFMSSDS